MNYSLNEITGGEHGRRVKDGMERAKERGAKLGRPRLLTSREVAEAVRVINNKQLTIRQVAAIFNVGYSTMRAYIKEAK